MLRPGHQAENVAVRLRNRAYDYVYVQNNAMHLRFTGTPDWFGRATAYAGEDRAVFPLTRADARARRELNRLAQDVRRERAQMLPALASRILASSDTSSDEILLYRLMTRIDDSVARSRLARAWLAPAARRRGVATDILAGLVESRWLAAESAGAASPLNVSRSEDDTLPDADDLAAFVARYGRDAATRRRLLSDAVGAAGGGAEALVHYPSYVWQRVGRCPPVQLQVTRAVELARLLLEACLDSSVGTTWSTDGVLLSLRDREDRVFGHVQVDLSTAGRVACAESPLSRAGDTVGRVLLRCRPSPHGDVMAFEPFFLFAHEIGHALTHVVRASRSVYRGPWSGLVYGPVLHAETISTLTEKVALHPDLATWFRIGSLGEAAALRARQQVTALEFLKNEGAQVAVARVDCVALGGGDRAPRRDLDEVPRETEPSSWPSTGQIVSYFLTQLLARHPGAAGVAYLVSNAYSCGLFESFREQPFEACVRSIGACVAGALGRGCQPPLDELGSSPVSAVYLPALTEGA
jgi:hypothetical protein